MDRIRGIDWKKIFATSLPIFSILTLHFATYMYGFSLKSIIFLDYYALANYFLHFVVLAALSFGSSRWVVSLFSRMFFISTIESSKYNGNNNRKLLNNWIFVENTIIYFISYLLFAIFFIQSLFITILIAFFFACCHDHFIHSSQ